MPADLIFKLQQELSLPELYKLDKVSQKLRSDKGVRVHPDRFAQSIIPATLIALATYSSTEGGALAVLQAGPNNNWANYLFTDRKEAVTRRIASYTGCTHVEICDAINKVAAVAIGLVRQRVNDIDGVKELLEYTGAEALNYLPADLQLGELLEERVMGHTGQANGDTPNIMQSISASLSGSDTDEVN